MQNSIVQWLEKTAARFPDKTAFVDEKGAYTWAEVRRMALSIASHVKRAVPGRKQPVAVYMETSADALIAFMGIAYSGNFYSPIATDMPMSRVEKILDVLHPQLVISTGGMGVDFAEKTLRFEDITGDTVDDKAARRYADRILDTDLLYVLFTSGSTGTPKGVAITHRSVIDLIDWVAEEYSIDESDSFGNESPFYFDNSVPGIFLSIRTGATFYVIPKELFSQTVKLLTYLKENRITSISWVPSALIKVAAQKAFREVDLSGTLKRVLFCGEVMPNKHLTVWRSYLPDVVYTNFYGPTEITYACTYYIVDREFSDEEPLPIGGPMRNTEILVLGEHDELVTEPDRVGELCVRGTCLAAGYYNNPEKTAAAFVQNPLQTAYEEKIYRTGDLVKYNDRHELIYLSRKDFQIKHLGHRIELGEIETAVSSLDGVGACCCLYNDRKGMIVLFVEGQFTRSEINERLADLLPRYMLPSKVVSLESLPLNANGKIDRVKLKQDYID